MKKLIVLLIAVCSVVTMAQIASSAQKPAKDLTAFCVTYPSDSTYKTHVIHRVKGLSHIGGNHFSGRGFGYFVNFPRNIGDQPSWRIYELKNSKKVLPKFYGQIFRGSLGESDGKNGREEKEFEVVLVDSCRKSMPVAHYCLIEGKHPRLYRQEEFENIPETRLRRGSADENGEDGYIESLYCEGPAKLENLIQWDFAENGKFTQASFAEEDSCHGRSEWQNNAKAIVPQYIDLMKDPDFKTSTAQLKNFYGKNISVEWNLSMECGFERNLKKFEYEILLTGKCPSSVKYDKKKDSKVDPWKLREVKVHGKYHYGRTFDDREPTNKCIERKILK